MSLRTSRRGFLAGAGGVCAATVPLASGSATTDATSSGTDERFPGLASRLAETAEDVLDGEDAAGAVVAVVDSEGVIHGEGYGHTTLDETEPITFDDSLFNIGSAVKPVTYTAAMALVDSGEVSTDDDVMRYLESVDVPETYDEPIALEHLATHTAGFEPRALADTASDVDAVEPLPESLSNQQPSRIYPPGEVPMYTNYAPALAGQLVADVVGDPFAEAMHELLFDPLGMKTATFDPSPDGLGGGPNQSVFDEKLWYSNVAPASGMSATGADMARFLRMHLGDGAVDDGRVLSPEATAEMHEQRYTPHEQLPGMAFGFFERFRGDTRILGHDGSVPGFNASLSFVPEMDVGLFVAAQGDRPFEARAALANAFLDEYVPDDTDAAPPEPSDRPDDGITGTYRYGLGLESTTYERGLFVMSGSTTVEIDVDAEDYLVIDDGTGDPTRYVEVEPDVFERTDGRRTLVFRRVDGEVTHVFTSESPIQPMVPDHPLDDPGTTALVAGPAALVMVSALLVWPGRVAWRYYEDRPPIPDGATRPGVVGTLTAGWPLLFLVAFAGLYGLGSPTGASDLPTGFEAVLYLPIVGAMATCVAVGFAANAFRNGQRSLAWVHYLSVAIASAVLLVVFHHWNLIGGPF